MEYWDAHETQAVVVNGEHGLRLTELRKNGILIFPETLPTPHTAPRSASARYEWRRWRNNTMPKTLPESPSTGNKTTPRITHVRISLDLSLEFISLLRVAVGLKRLGNHTLDRQHTPIEVLAVVALAEARMARSHQRDH
jgi:hypothetical protein